MTSWCCAPRRARWSRNWRVGGPRCRAAIPRPRPPPWKARHPPVGVAVGVVVDADAAVRRQRSRGPPEVSAAVTAYVGLGANLDDPAQQLRRAFDELAGLPDTRLTLRSPLYRSPPLGPPDQPDYINAVAALDTALAP